MKIVLTTHQFLPDHSSGTELIAYHIAKELQARGHQVTVITGYPAKIPLADAERFDSYTYEGLPVERFLHAHVPMAGQDNIIEAEYNNRLFHHWFRRYLTKNTPDVVHFVHLSRLSASAIEACRERSIPTVFTATDFWFICPTNQLRHPDNRLCTGPNSSATNCLRHLVQITQPPHVQKQVVRLPDWLLKLLVRGINRGFFSRKWFASYINALSARPHFLRNHLNLIDKVLAPSRIMGDLLIANGLDRARLTYLPYGIPVNHIPRRINKGLFPKLRVGFVGTLYDHKGPHVLIKAVKSLDPGIPIELTLHGKTDEFPAYVEELRTLIADDPRITLAGPFKNTQIGAILNSLDVLVCPSIWYENTPLVIYEAMAAGCPVIATNLGGMSESVQNNINGLLFEPSDAAQLAAHLRKLATDRAYLARLAANTTPPLSVPDHVSVLEDLYADLIARSPRAALTLSLAETSVPVLAAGQEE